MLKILFTFDPVSSSSAIFTVFLAAVRIDAFLSKKGLGSLSASIPSNNNNNNKLILLNNMKS